MLRAGDRIANWADPGVDYAIDHDMADPFADIDCEIDRQESGFVHLINHRRKDIEDRGARFGLLTRENRQYRLPLRVVRLGIDDDEGFAIALMDRLGPGEHADPAQARQIDVTEM